jgi:hypothetical protein
MRSQTFGAFLLVVPIFLILVPGIARAKSLKVQPLKVVSVNAPAINCVFNPSCKVVVNDTTSPITLNGAAGKGFLQSRTYTGKRGAPGSDRHVYIYRIDLRNSYGIVHVPCISTLALTGPVVGSLDYDKNGTPDHVFVITAGGLGSVGPKAAYKPGDVIKFVFDPPVCVGSSPGTGQSTFFFGVAANLGPRFVTATITEATGQAHSVQAGVPII